MLAANFSSIFLNIGGCCATFKFLKRAAILYLQSSSLNFFGLHGFQLPWFLYPSNIWTVSLADRASWQPSRCFCLAVNNSHYLIFTCACFTRFCSWTFLFNFSLEMFTSNCTIPWRNPISKNEFSGDFLPKIPRNTYFLGKVDTKLIIFALLWQIFFHFLQTSHDKL